MSDQLFMEERRRCILDQLQRSGRVAVKGLSEDFNVSEVTIRLDLRALEAANLAKRTHGGAVLPQRRNVSPELSYDVRLRTNTRIKAQIASYAARYVSHGDSIALDASTTVFAMLPYLKQLDELTIVTNSLIISRDLLNHRHIKVLMPGGQLRRDSVSLVGKPEALPKLQLSAGFISAHGYTKDTGFTESSLEESQMKRAILEQCISKYMLIDDKKWGKVTSFTIVQPEELSAIFTSRQAPSQFITSLKQRDVIVEFAD